MYFQNKQNNFSKHIVNSNETSKFIFEMMQTKNPRNQESSMNEKSHFERGSMCMNRLQFVCSSYFEHTGRDTPAKIELEWKNATNSLDFHYLSDFISFCLTSFRPRIECIDFAATLHRSKCTRWKVFYFQDDDDDDKICFRLRAARMTSIKEVKHTWKFSFHVSLKILMNREQK